MFYKFPFHVTTDLRQLALILNTVLLIVALIVIELVYSERPLEQRKHLRLFYPMVMVLGGLLIYAIVVQTRGQ